MTYLLLLIAIAPVLLISVYFYIRDKYEKEPVRVLLRAFSGGIYAVILLAVSAHGIFDLLLMYTSKIFNEQVAACLLMLILSFGCFIQLWRNSAARMKKHIEASCFRDPLYTNSLNL